MNYEKKTLIVVDDGRDDANIPEIVEGAIENLAYELYKDYMAHRITGDQIYVFEAIGVTPETEEEKEALESEVENNKAMKLLYVKPVAIGKSARAEYIYFKVDYDNGDGGPENFAKKIIDVVVNGRQVYLSYHGTIPHPELGTVEANVTIKEKNYCLSIPAEFDEWGDPWRTDDLGIVTDEKGRAFDLHEVNPYEDIVPEVPDVLWMDIAEEVVPNHW